MCNQKSFHWPVILRLQVYVFNLCHVVTLSFPKPSHIVLPPKSLIKPPPRKIACNMTGPAFTYPYLYWAAGFVVPFNLPQRGQRTEILSCEVTIKKSKSSWATPEGHLFPNQKALAYHSAILHPIYCSCLSCFYTRGCKQTDCLWLYCSPPSPSFSDFLWGWQ